MRKAVTNPAAARRWGLGKMSSGRAAMREVIGLDKQRPLGPGWLAIPFLIFAVVSLGIGELSARTVRQPYGAPYFSLYLFSDPLHMKIWLTTASAVLACFQLLTSARMYKVVRFPPQGRFYNIVHRWSGRTAIALTVPVAYHCIFLLGFGTYDARVYIHSLLGCMLYGAFLAKVIFVEFRRWPGWAIPVAGGTLFTLLIGLWLTTFPYFVSTFGLSL
jgi:hypothetical protein